MAKRTWQPSFCPMEVDQDGEEQLVQAGLVGFTKIDILERSEFSQVRISLFFPLWSCGQIDVQVKEANVRGALLQCSCF